LKIQKRETKSPAIHINPDCRDPTHSATAITAGAKSSKCQMAFIEIKV
jgi:hypothetical protein